MRGKKLPIGIDDFEKLRKKDYYYIDKTGWIREVLGNSGEVNLFTRPRRFGKTLNMSMLKCFFEIGTDPALFEGLEISLDKELCEEHLGKYPVVFLSMKSVDGSTFEAAVERLKTLLMEEALRLHDILQMDLLPSSDQDYLIQMERRAIPAVELPDSLKFLTRILYTCFKKKVILLIDEYDVPLDKAFTHGYYNEMVELIRGMLGQALKTNSFLEFAVLTGCLRISKESIFTGLNNFKVYTITDVRCDEYFGFTETEVKKLFSDYGLEEHIPEAKKWYDGYRFGNADVFCPWDVINYADHLRADPLAQPEAYWINTSGNALVKRFVCMGDGTTRDEIEELVSGKPIEKSLRLELTYQEIDNDINNLWSVLFTTGYLTQTERTGRNTYKLVIPNQEVREIFVSQVQEWFQEHVRADVDRINRFCAAFPAGDAETIEDMLNDYLWESISVRDTAVKNSMKENFYHGMLLGLLRSQGRWAVRSNAETGLGYSDISICTPERIGIVIELKYANDGDLEAACDRALRQIEEKQYAEMLRRKRMKKIICYGIAFCEKDCMVKLM